MLIDIINIKLGRLFLFNNIKKCFTVLGNMASNKQTYLYHSIYVRSDTKEAQIHL